MDALALLLALAALGLHLDPALAGRLRRKARTSVLRWAKGARR
jgi:hypothetical protein